MEKDKKGREAGEAGAGSGADAELARQVTQVIREAEGPLRAVDIVKKLADEKVKTNTTDVNKVLYNGPFDKVTAVGKPTWKLRAAPVVHPRPEGMHTFAVEGLAIVSVSSVLTAGQLQGLLRSLLELSGVTMIGKPVFRAEETEAGRALVTVATELGFSIGKNLPTV